MYPPRCIVTAGCPCNDASRACGRKIVKVQILVHTTLKSPRASACKTAFADVAKTHRTAGDLPHTDDSVLIRLGLSAYAAHGRRES